MRRGSKEDLGAQVSNLLLLMVADEIARTTAWWRWHKGFSQSEGTLFLNLFTFIPKTHTTRKEMFTKRFRITINHSVRNLSRCRIYTAVLSVHFSWRGDVPIQSKKDKKTNKGRSKGELRAMMSLANGNTWRTEGARSRAIAFLGPTAFNTIWSCSKSVTAFSDRRADTASKIG